MKKLFFILLSGFTLFPVLVRGENVAQVRLHCWSLRFQQGNAVDSAGFAWRLNLTTLPVGVNGELALDFFGSGYTHSAYAQVFSELDGDTFNGAIALNVPGGGDANGNGFADFFEVSQPVNSLTSSGGLQNAALNSNMEAIWSRDAGSSVGVCVIRVGDPWNPFETMDFVHTFELIEYTGTMSYTPASTTVSGNVDLVQTGNPPNSLFGALEFMKSSLNPSNQLTLVGATLTNSALQTFTLFSSSLIFRDTMLLTNYYGAVEFNDGNPDTAAEDYFTWEISIDDPNDTDLDTIPDFSDNPEIVLPRAPSLVLARGPTNLLLSISGDIGRTHRILQKTVLNSANWTTNLSVQLTNDPQIVSLPLPPAATSFWQVLAE